MFATRARFPDADEVVVEWPHRYLAATEVDARTVICVLTHDPKFDVPVLVEALRTRRRLHRGDGSRGGPTRTASSGCARRGSTDEQLARLRSPIGLDLGGRTPEETAVSIAAEIVQTALGRQRPPPDRHRGRIHLDPHPDRQPAHP